MNSVEHGRSDAGERQHIWMVRVAAVLFGMGIIAALTRIIWAAVLGGVGLFKAKVEWARFATVSAKKK